MYRRMLCSLLALVPASASYAAIPSTQPASTERPSWPERRIISGLVEDANGRRVAGAIVFLLDAQTGIPYSNITDHPFTDPKVAGEPMLIAHVATGGDGRFMIRGVFPGIYRLVAQSLDGAAGVKDLPDSKSSIVTLRGAISVMRNSATSSLPARTSKAALYSRSSHSPTSHVRPSSTK